MRPLGWVCFFDFGFDRRAKMRCDDTAPRAAPTNQRLSADANHLAQPNGDGIARNGTDAAQKTEESVEPSRRVVFQARIGKAPKELDDHHDVDVFPDKQQKYSTGNLGDTDQPSRPRLTRQYRRCVHPIDLNSEFAPPVRKRLRR